MGRPNILFAIADDASHMSAYGHSFVSTPNFDWVASQGALYTNAFTTNPKCAPSRASICTGMHTWQLEEACNHIVCTFPKKFHVFSEILDHAGYHVGYTGKGWAPGYWEETGRPYNPAGPCYNTITLTPPKNTNLSDIDYTENFRSFLGERTEKQPFMFWYGAHEPHRHYTPGEGIRNGKRLEDIDHIPQYWPDHEIVREDLLDYAFEIEWFDRHLGNMIKILKEMDELDNTIIVVTSDNGCPFPRVKGQMYEQDFHLPLAICWAGLQNGGRVVDDLVSFIDIAPTFIEAAGLPIPSQIEGSSLLPQIRSTSSGIIDATRTSVVMGRECHDAGRWGDLGYPVRCIRNKQFLYVHNFEPERWPAGNPETHFTNCDGSPTKDYIISQHTMGFDYYYHLSFGKRPQEELYDIIEDPECMVNLAGTPEYATIKEHLWDELKTILIETNDPRIHGNGAIFEVYASQKLSEMSSSWKAYEEGRWEVPGFMDWRRHLLKE